MHTVRENMQGDLGGSRKDNKAGYKDKVSSHPKEGKGGKKKNAEEKPRSAWHS